MITTNAAGGDTKLAEDKSAPVSPPPPPYQYEKGTVTALEWVGENITNDFFERIKRYFISLFPIFSWIYRYNLAWASGGTSVKDDS
jgi:hypothetical protein